MVMVRKYIFLTTMNFFYNNYSILLYIVFGLIGLSPRERKKQVPFCVAKENMELLPEFCP